LFKSGYLLDSPEKIAAAIHNKTPVDIWQDDKIAYYGGPIQLQTEAAVKINGSYYLKINYEFRIR